LSVKRARSRCLMRSRDRRLWCHRSVQQTPWRSRRLVGRHAVTEPIAALDAWLALRGTDPGPLFTHAHHRRVATRTITGSGLTNVLKDRAAAGIHSDRITGHSLRAGHTTTAALAGVGLDRIAAQTGTAASPPWSSTTSTRLKPMTPILQALE
jgi:integrase